MSKCSVAAAAIVAVGLAGIGGVAHAAPATGLVTGAAALTDDARTVSSTETVRWVCGPYGRCVWVRPRPHVYGFHGHGYGRWYGPRYHVGPRPWRPYRHYW
jgi:hypothetical protein